MPKRSLFILVLLALIAAGAYWYWLPRPAPPAPVQAGGPPPAAVEVAAAESGTVTNRIEAAGSLRANEQVVIAPEIAGRVAAIPFDEGSRVTKGEALVELDASTLEAEATQARANLALTRMTFERAQTLVERGSGTRVSLDEATIKYEVARAEAAIAEDRLAKTRIAAPFAGIVGLRSISVGDYVTPGRDMVTLASIDPIKVDFRVPELFLDRLAVGLPIEVGVDAFPDRRFTGEVYAIDPVVDINGRAVQLRARIANDDGLLKPGLFARVSLELETRKDAVMVPESALVPQGGDKYVYLVEDGTAKLTRVEIGARMPGRVEIVSGVAAGATVVTAGQLRLRDGARVNIVKANPDA